LACELNCSAKTGGGTGIWRVARPPLVHLGYGPGFSQLAACYYCQLFSLAPATSLKKIGLLDYSEHSSCEYSLRQHELFTVYWLVIILNSF